MDEFSHTASKVGRSESARALRLQRILEKGELPGIFGSLSSREASIAISGITNHVSLKEVSKACRTDSVRESVESAAVRGMCHALKPRTPAEQILIAELALDRLESALPPASINNVVPIQRGREATATTQDSAPQVAP